MGYHDSLNAIKKSVAAGKVEITIDGVDVVFSGDTFRHKDFLKTPQHRLPLGQGSQVLEGECWKPLQPQQGIDRGDFRQ